MAIHESDRIRSSERRPQAKSWILFAALVVATGSLVIWQRNSWQLLLDMQEGKDSRGVPVSDRPVSEGFHPVVVIPRSFPPITDVPVAKAEEVVRPGARAAIRDDELVLGVAINGQARAYPINMLTGPQREIINDTVGDAAIAATW